MAYKALFLDNEQYSAADLNDCLKSFVTSGIADPFEDGCAYHVTKMNEITSALATDGAVYEDDNTCRCSINTNDKTLHIAPGTIFFSDGSRIVIDEEGVALSYTEKKTNYVFAKSVPAENFAQILCQTEPPSGEYVNIAEISNEETLYDKRTFSRGKLPGYQSNAGLPIFIDETIELTAVSSEKGNNDYTAEKVINLGPNNTYKILAFYSENQKEWGFYDILNDTYRSCYHNNGEYRSTDDLLMLERYNAATVSATVKKDGDSLIMSIKGYELKKIEVHIKIY